ncbi:6,7-dimethyl-8-ribityllumazine synthase [Saxibacter everestensis]|uniref:6,7-dimethyl-8-ribityllumazine synthase n=1 Tax=Saxibacter everestensis TaxID=2909229 RepID=A0ABY8QWL6_9MICO|nr:6,7-dimethyl-8-ribityllumazine synthase [Brevibacteriaceae bacterium ZFBP1038]
MSNAGTPGIGINEGRLADGTTIPRLRVGIVAASWHTTVMDGLIAGAKRVCELADLEPTVLRAPGSFELPVFASRMARADYDAIIALGVVIRGGTPHFDYVCQAATIGLTDVSTRTGIPVGFGLLTCDDEQQALDRAGLPGSIEDKGAEAAEAAISSAVVLKAARL